MALFQLAGVPSAFSFLKYFISNLPLNYFNSAATE